MASYDMLFEVPKFVTILKTSYPQKFISSNISRPTTFIANIICCDTNKDQLAIYDALMFKDIQ